MKYCSLFFKTLVPDKCKVCNTFQELFFAYLFRNAYFFSIFDNFWIAYFSVKKIRFWSNLCLKFIKRSTFCESEQKISSETVKNAQNGKILGNYFHLHTSECNIQFWALLVLLTIFLQFMTQFSFMHQLSITFNTSISQSITLFSVIFQSCLPIEFLMHFLIYFPEWSMMKLVRPSFFSLISAFLLLNGNASSLEVAKGEESRKCFVCYSCSRVELSQSLQCQENFGQCMVTIPFNFLRNLMYENWKFGNCFRGQQLCSTEYLHRFTEWF